MGKKGRQSGGFGRKSQNSEWKKQWQREASSIPRNRPTKSSAVATASKERPRFAGLSQLKGLIRERQSHEQYELLERRRRQGFVPRPKEEQTSAQEQSKVPHHPPGWLLNYNEGSYSHSYTASRSIQNTEHIHEFDKSPPTSVPIRVIQPLHSSCLDTLADYLPDYLDALGMHELHDSLALLPSDVLAELSIIVSKRHGMNNRLAFCLGAHAHVQALSFHAAIHKDETLGNDGILSLVPTMPSSQKIIQASQHDTWEELIDRNEDDIGCDLLQLEGVSMKLRRLELVNCSLVTFDAIEQLLSKCSWITHLSLAGSLTEDGVEVLVKLPQWLPALQVLDLTNCVWVTSEALYDFTESYPDNMKRPKVYSGGCVKDVYVSPSEW